MSAALQLIRPMQQRCGSDAAVLTDIFAAEVNLAIWQRAPQPAIEAYAQWLLTQAVAQPSLAFRAIQKVVTPAELPAVLQQQLPDATGKTELMADLQLLSEMLCCLMDCSAVGFRLKLLQQPMCPRFHTDHVALRLLVTYAGTGTEWLPQAPAAGSSDSFSGNSSPSAAAKSANQPQQISAQQVALLKGSAWQGNQQGAILHRSPAAAGRLLLSLDPVGD